MELNKKLEISCDLVSKEDFKNWVQKVLDCENGMFRGVDIEFALDVMNQLKDNKSFDSIEKNLSQDLSIYITEGERKDLSKSKSKSLANHILDIVCKYYMYKPHAKNFRDYFLNNKNIEVEEYAM